ncbi:MAG: hypothetical protein MRJ93_11915 [Nitrososphaeraceae archaeon]|nr:hypothetical protein [Nitrososphaeraceae archaeon]
MSLSSFCKMALYYFCNNYRDNVFSNNAVNKIDIDDTDTFEKFLAFRVKYTNYPLDKQIEDLKKDGYLQ